jgi:hypothetical protein
MSTHGTEPAFLFEDRQSPDDWHVQWTAADGGFEMAIFSGPRAHERAIMFAERCYGGYEEIRSNQGSRHGHGSARAIQGD